MRQGRTFTIGDFFVDPQASKIVFHYHAVLADGTTADFTEVLSFPGCQMHMWDAVPAELLQRACESISMVLGIHYWKIFCSPQIETKSFTLGEQQAAFWKTLYTHGLGEFFYNSRIDFHGLVNISSGASAFAPPPSYPREDRTLLAQGGGKDSLVSAEFLKECGVPFDIFVFGTTVMQDRVIQSLKTTTRHVFSIRDPRFFEEIRDHQIDWAEPGMLAYYFIATLTALLFDYRYVAFSNEASADLPNSSYLNMSINHQWGKSREAEHLIREYIHSYVTRDIEIFSLCRQYSEIEMVRRFSRYPKYFHIFSSCNQNFFITPAQALARPGRAYWCNRCAKCAFIFASMSAFVSREALEDIFGENMYDNEELTPLFKRLLGLEGFKPFECVGSADEMIVAMHLAHKRRVYDETPVMKVFLQHFTDPKPLDILERKVLSPHGDSWIPLAFLSRIGGDDGKEPGAVG